MSKSTSHPQLSISIPEAEIHVESQDQRISNTPSPATGQLRPESQELIDGRCLLISVHNCAPYNYGSVRSIELSCLYDYH